MDRDPGMLYALKHVIVESQLSDIKPQLKQIHRPWGQESNQIVVSHLLGGPPHDRLDYRVKSHPTRALLRDRVGRL